ncbi:MAG: hypothetical protein KGL93_06585 [Gemmatimonadota bacterium]|nr:hypothetical protein [Gemmatimonadota bacterium]
MRSSLPAALVAAALAGCTASTPKPAATAAPPTATAPNASLVRVVAHDFTFDGDKTAPAGLVAVRLVNQGHAIHMMGVARMDSGKTLADVVRDITNPKVDMSYWHELGGPGAVSAGDSVTDYLVLEPGTYSLICFWPDSTGKGHVQDGMMATLTVTGTNAGAPALPAPDVYVRQTDFHLELPDTLNAGPHMFRIDNDGPSSHDLAVLRILPGHDEAAIETWLEHPTMHDAPVEAVGGIVGQSRWASSEFAATLPAGDYLFLCMMPMPGGKGTHYMHGMIKRVHVT